MKIGIFITAVVIIMSSLSCEKDRKPVKTGLEGTNLPPISLILPDSTISELQFNSNLNPVVLFYFSPTCPYCKAQTRDIVRNIDRLNNIDFVFLADSPIKDIMLFIDYFNLKKFSNIKVGVDGSHLMQTYFRASRVPFTAIYGSDKKLNVAYVGNIGSFLLKSSAIAKGN